MRYRPSLETDLKILEVLVLEKEFCQYDLPKRIDKDYRTVLRHLKSLKEDGFIQLVRTEKSEKKGKEKNIWAVTPSGLLEVLQMEHVWEHIDKIAEKYAGMFPMIFGKWHFFAEKGVKDAVTWGFQMWTPFFSRRTRWLHVIKSETEKREQLTNGQFEVLSNFRKAVRDPIQDLTNAVLGVYPFGTEEFISILKSDPDLRRYIDNQFDKLEREYLDYISEIKRYKQVEAYEGTYGEALMKKIERQDRPVKRHKITK